MHGLHVRERGEHHLDLGRAEHLRVALEVVVLHLDVGLREEAEHLREQIALAVGEPQPVLAVLAERDLLGQPVDLLLAAPELDRPRIPERLVARARLHEPGELQELDLRALLHGADRLRASWISCGHRRHLPH